MIPPAPVTRFAPSPTGHLHLGHILNAIHTWGVARRYNGVVILRMEDHDRGRARPEYEQSILDDLEWLGFVPDRGSVAEFRSVSSAFRQSDHPTRYTHALDRLDAIYACSCTRKEIAARTGEGDELRYPGTCRTRNLPTEGNGLRVVLDELTVEFDDLVAGPQAQVPAAQCGDVLLRDRHGNWTYQWAVTVDDLEEGIDLVIRGEDLLPSTGRQIQLASMLGRETPAVFYHHPLILDGEGRKLSKRDHATGIRELRAAGRTPGEVLGRAAWLGGLLDHERAVAVGELPELFAGLG